MLNADSLAFPEEEDKKESLNEVQISDLASTVESRFQSASLAKRAHEDRMINAYDNFRGLYGKNVPHRKSEKSKVFVKVTKTKVLAGYGQIVDITLGGDKFPIGLRPTSIPEGEYDIAHVESAVDQIVNKADAVEPANDSYESPYDVGYEGDGKELEPGATFGKKLFKAIKEKVSGSSSEEDKLVAGPALEPGAPQIEPAKIAAEKMEKLIHDQLEESNSVSELSNAIFECVMLGTGIVKGPFTYSKTLHKWYKNEEGKRVYTPVKVKVPRIEFVSAWDAYPDPNATCKEEMTYFIHRHRFNASQMRNLLKMPLFDKVEVQTCLENGPNYTKQSYEHHITASSEENIGRDFSDRWEVLEYWGTMGVDEAKDAGLSVKDMEELDEVQINAWVCGGRILRIVANPFTPSRIPYHIFNYERNPYSIFGVGIPENMSDSQQVMNGHARMAIDNLALSGGLVFDIDETSLVPGQSMEIYNGKIFYRQAGSAGQAVHGIKFPNTTQENLSMFDKFRQLADEETGIPSYAHGQTGIQTTTRTASGMSMLLGAASLNVKTVIKNIDNQLLKPLGQDFFQWNMQFFEGDLEVEGDLEIVPMGTSSLMQKEVRSQRLTMFLQTAMNPSVAPYVKIPYIVEEIAKSLDLDKDLILNTTEEARLSAQIIGLQNNGQTTATSQEASALGQQPTNAGSPDGVLPDAAGPGSTGNGNGNIGTGDVPQPGEDEFSA